MTRVITGGTMRPTFPHRSARAIRSLAILSAAMLMAGFAGTGAQAQDMRNIANEKGSSERPYGETRGWTVSSGWIGQKFSYCAAERLIDGEPMRIGFDNAQWQLAVPYPAAKDYEGAITVDGRRWPASGSSDGKWTFVWLDLGMLDSLRNGREVIVDIKRASINKPLAGIAASITKVEECLTRRGNPPGGASAPQGQTPPVPMRQDQAMAPPQAAAPPPSASQRGAARVEEIAPNVFRVERTLSDGWSMFRFTSDRASRKPLQCMVFKMTGSEQGLRLGMDRATRSLTFGFMGDASATIQGNTRLTYWFDNDRASGASKPGYNFVELDTSEWLSITQPSTDMSVQDKLMSFQKITFSYSAEGKAKTASFPLKGSNTALKELFECVDH